MRLKALLLAISLPMSLSACGQNGDTEVAGLNNAGADDVALANDGMSLAPSRAAQDFVNKVAKSDRFEIESSKLAAASASSTAIKDFAVMMVTAHTDSSAKLKSTLTSDPTRIVPDDALNDEQKATLDDLKSKKGAEFDTAYAAAQVSEHEKTLAELKNYAATGDDPALKAFAQELVPTVTEHLNKAKGLK